MHPQRLRQLTLINRTLQSLVEEIVAIANDVQDLEWHVSPQKKRERSDEGMSARSERDARVQAETRRRSNAREREAAPPKKPAKRRKKVQAKSA